MLRQLLFYLGLQVLFASVERVELLKNERVFDKNRIDNSKLKTESTNFDYGSLRNNGVVLYGETILSTAGAVLCTVGDINRDGYADFVIGANGYEDAKGRIYLIYGTPTLPYSIYLSAVNEVGITITGSQAGDDFGSSCAGTGDVNNDGFSDFLVGAPDSGNAYLIYGGATLSSQISLDSLGSAGVIIQAESVNDKLGAAVATAGDVNNDGIDDFLLGAPQYSGGTGRVYLIYGSETLPETIALSSLGSAGVVITGIASDSSCGAAISPAGDVNKDSYHDFLIGCYGYSDNTGQVYLMYGSNSLAASVSLSSLLPAEGITFMGTKPSSFAGWALSGGTDINGDTYPDFVISAKGNVSVVGQIYVIYGSESLPSATSLDSLSSIGITITGGTATDSAGYAITSTGDINQDGKVDIIISATGYSSLTGRVYVIYGSSSLANSINLEPFGSVDITITGDIVGDQLGTAVAYAGDVNGDSYADFLLSSPWSDTLTGKVTLLYGGNELASTLALGSLDSVVMVGGASEWAGSAIASVGDVNGDGYDDLIVGAVQYNTQMGRAIIVYGVSSYSKRFSLDSLSSGAGFVLEGEATGDRAGWAVSGIGDLNHDGFADFLVSANGYSSDTGKVYLIYGSNSQRAPTTLAAAAGCTITGLNPNDLAGSSLAGLGDVNQDTIPDYVIVSPGIGTAYLILGNATATTIDLSSSTDVACTIVGETGSGVSVLQTVGSAGDINADGYMDFLLGASSLNSNMGAAYVVYGAASLPTTLLLDSLDSAGIKFIAEAAADELGAAVSTAGDINHDGYDDLLIGAPGYNSETGIVYLIYGGPTLTSNTTIFMRKIDIPTGVRIYGESYYNSVTGTYSKDYLGSSVHTAGDINNDGYDDFILGAPNYSEKRGKAYIIYGGDNLPGDLRLSELGSRGFTLSGETNSDVAGIAVSTAGDVDSDGFSDVIIGSSTLLSGLGGVYLIYGQSNGAPMPSSAPTLEPTSYVPAVGPLPFKLPVASILGYGITITGTVYGSRSGISVAGLGDISNDGVDDFAINTYPDTEAVSKVYLFYGKARKSAKALENSANVLLTGEEPFDGFAAICSAGDINNDGINDLLLSAPYVSGAKGRVYILFGSSSLPRSISIGSLGSRGLIIDGESSGDYAGSEVAALGDFNHDGIDDIVIGAPSAHSSDGKVYILYGNPSLPTSLSLSALGTAGVTITGEAGSIAGSTLTAADVNGDGHPDLLIGAPHYNYGIGRLYILYSPATALSSTAVLPDVVKGGAGVRVVVGGGWGGLGWNLASIGDLNGDGYDDFMSTFSVGESYVNIVVIFGSSSLSDRLSVRDLDSSQGLYIDSNAFGISYSMTVGDFNRDGFDDFLIGTGGKSTDDHYYGGLAFVLFGKATFPSSLSLGSLGELGITLLGEADYSYLGQSVAFIGDVNNDTFMDILVGAPSYNSDQGRSYILYGTNNTEEYVPTSYPTSIPTASPTLTLKVLHYIFTAAAIQAGNEVQNYFSGEYDALLMNGAQIVNAFYPYQSEGLQLSAISQQYLRINKRFRIGGKNGLTVSWWQRPAVIDPNAKIFDFGNGEAADNFLCTVATTCQLYYADQPVAAVNLPVECISDAGIWCFLTLTLTYAPFNESTSTWTFYVNGSFYASQDNLYYPEEIERTTAYLGRGQWTSDTYYDGLLGSFQLSNYLMPASEILASYELAPTSMPSAAPTSAPSTVPTVIPFESLGVSSLLSYQGRKVGDETGVVSSAGDVNGDGFADFLVGSPGWNNTKGRVLLFSGSSNPTSLDYTVELYGEAERDRAGYAVAGVGDVNQDGFDDLIIGAPYRGYNYSGRSYLIYGSADLPVGIDLTSLGSLGVIIDGDIDHRLSGLSVAAAGDFDKDGFKDIIIGCDGIAYLLYGSATLPGSINLATLGNSGITFTGEYSIGNAVAFAGDVNGDSYDDLLLGAPHYGEGSGAVFLVFGGNSRPAAYDFTVETDWIGIYGDQIGWIMNTAGDVNNDGFGDLLIGSPTYNSDTGIAYLIYGNTSASLPSSISVSSALGDRGIVIKAPQLRSQTGSAVAGIDDINGDGFTDFVLAASQYSFSNTAYADDDYHEASKEGVVYLIYGSQSLPSTVHLDTLGSLGVSYIGDIDQGGIGTSLANAGDFRNNDAVNILVGAQFSLNKAGKTYLILGASLSPTGVPSRQPSSLPTGQPSDQPTGQPSEQPQSSPSSLPTGLPTTQPSQQPSSYPTGQPTGQPQARPSSLPSGQPGSQPSGQPSISPSGQPTSQPQSRPSSLPTGQPSRQPSGKPSCQPTGQPTSQPLGRPSSTPSGRPTTQPSQQPSSQPTGQPTSQPLGRPSSTPSGRPTTQPSLQPSSQPTGNPTSQPQGRPSSLPTGQPSNQPSRQPSSQPSGQPSNLPQSAPSSVPTGQPTTQPSRRPSSNPTAQPTSQPQGRPSGIPSGQPTGQPTGLPNSSPTGQPTSQPQSKPSGLPSGQPSSQPSEQPSSYPTGQPTDQPLGYPSSLPSGQPTAQPSGLPNSSPTGQPTSQPQARPSSIPSTQPTTEPSGQPNSWPTGQPTSQPQGRPSSLPSSCPSGDPSTFPTSSPTNAPYPLPIPCPSSSPTGQPSGKPTFTPTFDYQTLPALTSSTFTVAPSFFFLNDLMLNRSYVFGARSAGTTFNFTLAVSFFASLGGFVQLKSDGSLSAWGSAFDIRGWQQYQSPGFDIIAIISNEHAFCGLTATGRVIAFGSSDHGGVIPTSYANVLSSNVIEIVASSAAFCALRADKTVYCWGNPVVGGGVSSVTQPELTQIESLYSNRGAFAALNDQNQLFTWGGCVYGGCQEGFVRNVLEVFTTKTVFLALLKTGKIMTWGNERFGGSPPDSIASVLTGSLKSIVSTTGAIAVILGNNSVVSWGHSRYGGDSSAVQSDLHSITSIHSTLRAFAALHSSGKVVTWGDVAYGGRLNSLTEDIKKVVASRGAFAALHSNGSVIVWGRSVDGGTLSNSLQSLLQSKVVFLEGIENGFIALKIDGNVIGWGNAQSFPSPGILTNIGANVVQRFLLAL